MAYEREHCFSPHNAPAGTLPSLAFDDECAPATALSQSGGLGELGGWKGAVAHCREAVADLDSPLPPADRAEAAAFAALVEERLAPATVRARLAPGAGVGSPLSRRLPALRRLAGRPGVPQAHTGASRSRSPVHASLTRPQRVYGQGLPLGVASLETQRWRRDVAACVQARGGEASAAAAAAALPLFAARLASSGGAYLLGALPCSADAMLLAQLAFILHAPSLKDSPLRKLLLAAENQALLGYVKRHLEGGLFGAPGEGAVRPGASPPLRRPAASAPGAGAATAPAGGLWGLSERRKSQLSVLFALSSCLGYLVLNDQIELYFLDAEEEEGEDGEGELPEDDGGDD